MKFKDIKRLTPPGSYQVNVSIKYLKELIDEHSDPERYPSPLDMNPDFQRGYVWTDYQQIKFIEYFLRGGIVNPIYFNCVGWMNSFEGPFVIVDGKQRINAALNFLNNEIPAFGYYYEEYEDPIRMINNTFIININNLKTRKDVLQWYIDLNTGGTVHTNEEIEKVKRMIEEEI